MQSIRQVHRLLESIGSLYDMETGNRSKVEIKAIDLLEKKERLRK